MTTTVAPLDIAQLRREARQHVEDGAVTASYAGDRERVLEMLNGALATELVCVLRYRCHHFMASGIHAPDLAREFLEHSNEELEHADQLAQRIVQLGGEPGFAPDSLSARSHAEYAAADSLAAMVRENLVAERIAIESYRHFISVLGDNDPTTRRLIESILAVEERHADELAGLLHGLGPAPYAPPMKVAMAAQAA